MQENWCYRLLLAVSVMFVLTALAYALVPWDSLPGWFQAKGWWLLLAEVFLVIVLGLLSMAVDRARLKKGQSPADEAGRSQP